MMLFRQSHPDYPFLWESEQQPAGRWHAVGEGPVQYFSTTADGAWAELLRHEEITDPTDLEGIRERAMWIVSLDEPDLQGPQLGAAVLMGGLESYEACQREARRLRASGSHGLRTPSAALDMGGVQLYYVDGGQQIEAGNSDVVALFGPRPDLKAHKAAIGRPDPRILDRVRPL